MRLTYAQIQVIQTSTEELFGRNVRVSLFGSRIDDHQRGSDLDLLIEIDRVLDNRPTMEALFPTRLHR